LMRPPITTMGTMLMACIFIMFVIMEGSEPEPENENETVAVRYE
jgi:hypothetical protein